MGDANVRRPVATRFEHGVDFGLLVHKSPFMADKRDPRVLSNYIFELLEVNLGVAGFLIQLHPEHVDAVVESVTAHAEKGAETKMILYVPCHLCLLLLNVIICVECLLFDCVGIAVLLAACCASSICCSSLVTVADDLTVLFFCVVVVLLCCVL